MRSSRGSMSGRGLRRGVEPFRSPRNRPRTGHPAPLAGRRIVRERFRMSAPRVGYGGPPSTPFGAPGGEWRTGAPDTAPVGGDDRYLRSPYTASAYWPPTCSCPSVVGFLGADPSHSEPS